MPASAFPRNRLTFLATSLACVLLAATTRADDVSPRFQAVTAYDEGRYEDALAAIDTAPPASDLAYLRIRVLAALGRHGEALDASKTPSRDWPAQVLDDLADLRIDWAASAGRCDGLEEKQGRARASRARERLLARCAFSAREYTRVKELLASANDADGRALYARALMELGEKDAAAPLARAFYVEHPGHRDAARMRTFLEETSGPLKLTPEERIQRAEGLLEARQPEAAVDELAPLKKIKDKKLEAKLWHVRGDALFRTRKRYPEAQKAFARAAQLHSETEEYDAFHAIRSASRAGDDKSAIKRYKAFAAKNPKSKLAPDAVFLSAWLSAREKLPNARRELESFVESKHAARARGLRRDALWELGFQSVLKRATRDAAKWLAAYEETVDRPLERARAAYWLGRAALIGKDKSAARTHFQRSLAQDRLGYYAQLAARRLVALGDESPAAFAPTPSPLERPAVQNLPEEVRFYRDIGLFPEAADAANRFLGQSADRARRVATLLETGDASVLFYAAEPLLERALEGPPDEKRAWIWQALFPQPHLRIVVEQTEKNGLASALFYGHMQTESHYKPRVVSGADAIGLMQLLPETASAVGHRIGLEVHRGDLMRPHVNITLGAAYLGSLVKRYQGQFPLAIAAYNVGTQKVDEWLGRSKEIELDVWVESIPVEQTRNYVRRVITAWSRYHALGAPDRPWDLPLPNKVRRPTI